MIGRCKSGLFRAITDAGGDVCLLAHLLMLGVTLARFLYTQLQVVGVSGDDFQAALLHQMQQLERCTGGSLLTDLPLLHR